MADEIEGKLVLTSDDRHEVIEAIASLDRAGGYNVVMRAEHTITDAYFDTAAGDLTAARLALRIRNEDGLDFLTLKGDSRVQDGVIARHELEQEWSTEALAAVLQAIAADGVHLETARLDTERGAEAALRSLGMAPTSPRRNHRTVLALADASGEVVAELDVDRVVFTAGDTTVRHYEVECEVHGGNDEEVIRAILADLRSRFAGLEPVAYSKLDLAEELEHLAATGRLDDLLQDDGLTAAAYREVERSITWGRPTP